MSKRGEREREKGGRRRRRRRDSKKNFGECLKFEWFSTPSKTVECVLRICVYLDDFGMKAHCSRSALWNVRRIENDIRLIGFDRVCIANDTSLLSHVHNSHISIYCVPLVKFSPN